MTTDFRALCVELTDCLEKADWPNRYKQVFQFWVDIARGALAESDGPAVPEGKKPTRDELWELWLRLNNELPDRPAAVAEFWEHAQINAHARAVLAQPEPGSKRRYIYNPAQIAECGGPCQQGPDHCDCGELWITEPELENHQ